MDGQERDSEPTNRSKESGKKKSGILERAVLLLGEAIFSSKTSVNISDSTVSHPRK
jgi:hypothetical protein